MINRLTENENPVNTVIIRIHPGVPLLGKRADEEVREALRTLDCITPDDKIKRSFRKAHITNLKTGVHTFTIWRK